MSARLVLNRAGVGALLKSNEMRDVCYHVATSYGDDYKVTNSRVGKSRCMVEIVRSKKSEGERNDNRS